MTVQSLSPVLFAGKSMITTSLGANDPEVGTTMRVGNKDYRFVYNAGGASGAVGRAVIVSAVSGYSVTVSSVTGSANPLVGVIENNTLTTGAYAWVVKRGPCQVQMSANNSAAVGDKLTLGTDGGWARHASQATDTQGEVIYGVAMEAIASGASGTAFIRTFV